MLAGTEIVATVAVKDLGVARKFYEGTLGLKVEEEQRNGGAHLQEQSGCTGLIVYRSQFAGTNKATALNLMVGGEIEEVVGGSRARRASSTTTCPG